MRASTASLQGSLELLRRLDPGDVQNTQKAVEARLHSIEENFATLSNELNELPANVRTTFDLASEQSESQFKSAAVRQWIILTFVLVVSGISLFGFYLEHGFEDWFAESELVNDLVSDVELAEQLLSDALSERDYAEAARLLRPAAEQGDADAQNNLGALYLLGQGVPREPQEAARWFRPAAEQGLAEAQYNLGNLYMTGEGVPIKESEAVRWWGLAADQGYLDALYNLGIAYSDGVGVEQDRATAAEWLLIASEQGHADAQLSLGMMYLAGDGIDADNIQAYKWLMLAAEGYRNTNEELQNRALEQKEIAVLRMSDNEIATAELLVNAAGTQ